MAETIILLAIAVSPFILSSLYSIRSRDKMNKLNDLAINQETIEYFDRLFGVSKGDD